MPSTMILCLSLAYKRLDTAVHPFLVNLVSLFPIIAIQLPLNTKALPPIIDDLYSPPVSI